MKLQRKAKQNTPPEQYRDTDHLTRAQKGLGLVSVCGLSAALGIFCGAVIWAILRIMNAGIEFIWTILPSMLDCGASLLYALIVCLAGGLLIGLVQRQTGPLPDNLEQVIGRIRTQGRYPYDRLPLIAVCALLPLIFGGALGPEAGLSGLIAGLCCWTADRLKCQGDQIAALTETGLAAVLGVIFGAPLFGIVSNLEPGNGSARQYREKLVRKRTRIIIYCFGVAGSLLAFRGLGHLFGGGSGLPRFDAHHAIGLDQWMWFIPLLAIGIAFSLFYLVIQRLTTQLGSRLTAHPVISCLIPGVCIAISGHFFPMTMFSGEHELADLTGTWSEYSVPLLVLTAMLKLLLVNICLNFGWRGGSIFPLIFSGACLGFAFALISGMDGAFAAAVVISALYAYQLRKPVAVIMVLLLCFPITYIIPIGIAAFAASKIPTPFARRSEKE